MELGESLSHLLNGLAGMESKAQADFDAGTKFWINGVLLHKWVTNTQSAKYGGDYDRHVALDDHYCCFHTS